MTNLKKASEQSILVKTVLSLDTHFQSLERLSARIGEAELKSEFDYSQIRRLMLAFAESAHSVSTEFVELLTTISEAKNRAEAAAQVVAAKADELKVRQDEEQSKAEAFRSLTEKVSLLNSEMKLLQRPAGETLSEEDKAVLTDQLSKLELQLRPLIEESLHLKKEARNSGLKALEQNVDALGQSLAAASHKLTSHVKSQTM
ncbi:MAG: hypothetical protein V4654_13915 [Bdellovibrionota bacterium]